MAARAVNDFVHIPQLANPFAGNIFNVISIDLGHTPAIFVFYIFAIQLTHAASIFVDYVTNLDAGQFDTGYALGFNIGSAKTAGTWKFGWMYKDLEADAVFGLLTDSDFAGGGADGKGHVLKGSYAIAPNWNANMTYFMNEIGTNEGSEIDFDRLQFDMSFKY